MKKIIALILLTVSFTAQAQTWNKLYLNNLEPMNYSRPYGCKVWNDTIYVSQMLADSTNSQRAAFSKYDMIGDLVDFQIYEVVNETHSSWNWSWSGYNQLSNQNDSLIYLSFNHGVFPNDVHLGGWASINSQLEMVSLHDQTGIFEADNLVFNGVHKVDSALYLFGNRWQGEYFNSNDSSNAIVIKTDLQGNPIWKKAFEDTYSTNTLIELSDGDLIMNTEWHGDTYQNPKRLIKTNPQGEEQWRMTFGGMYTIGYTTLLETSDGKILVANDWNVYYSDEPGVEWWYPRWIQFQLIEDLGSTYEIEQDIKWAPTRVVDNVYGIEEMTNGNYLSWGTSRSFTGASYDSDNQLWDRPFDRGFLFMLDDTLDSLWMRTYYYPDDDDQLECYSSFQITDLSPLEDGGFVTCGWGRIHDENYLEKIWLMRLDEYGCLEPGCQNIDVTEIVLGFENSMSVFPNPVKDICTIEWNVDKVSTIEKNFSQSELIITDTQGREMQRLPVNNFGNRHHMQIDMNSFASGMYQVHWVSDGAWLDTVQVVKE